MSPIKFLTYLKFVSVLARINVASAYHCQAGEFQPASVNSLLCTFITSSVFLSFVNDHEYFVCAGSGI